MGAWPSLRLRSRPPRLLVLPRGCSALFRLGVAWAPSWAPGCPCLGGVRNSQWGPLWPLQKWALRHRGWEVSRPGLPTAFLPFPRHRLTSNQDSASHLPPVPGDPTRWAFPCLPLLRRVTVALCLLTRGHKVLAPGSRPVPSHGPAAQGVVRIHTVFAY